MLWPVCAGVIAGLIAPAAASADVLETFRRLAERELRPAPLVPTTAPAPVRPVDRSLEGTPSLRRSGYGVRLVGRGAIVAISGGDYANMRAARRDFKGYRVRSLRIRGHRGFVFTHRNYRVLVWSEGGRVYSIGSGTPKKVSIAQMRATAAGLQPLGSYYIGGSSDPNSSAEADLVTTSHTVTVRLEFNANCTSTPRAGQAAIVLAPLSGNTFTFDVAEHRIGSAPWTGSVSGTVGANSATVQYQVSGTIGGEACSGSETLTLPRSGS